MEVIWGHQTARCFLGVTPMRHPTVSTHSKPLTSPLESVWWENRKLTEIITIKAMTAKRNVLGP